MMQHRIIRLILIVTAACMPLCAEASAKDFFKKLKHRLDSSALRGVDTTYVGLPRKKWSISYNTNVDQMRLTISAATKDNSSQIPLCYEMYMKIRQKETTSMGLWAGYRGFGFGYSLSLTGNEGTNISVGIASRAYGLNARFYRFKHDTPLFGIENMTMNGEPVHDDRLSEREYFMPNPMTITALVIDGYYIFNRKRFSHAAAYSQSTLQLRSAGSPIVGLMFYYQKYDPNLNIATPLNPDSNVGAMLLLTRDITTFKAYQGSIGAGYTYNWVPARGWVINLTAMPVLTLLNRLTVHEYDTKVGGSVADKSQYIYLVDQGEKSHGGRVKLNADVKAAVCYWLKDWYFMASGQVHYFRSNYDPVTTTYFDWSGKACVGFTF